MALSKRLAQLGAFFSTGAVLGCALGLGVGIGLMHWRFADEIANYDKERTFAYACDTVLHMAGLKKVESDEQ